MNLELSGKGALVCASSAGIGRAIAMELAGEGADVFLLGRDKKNLIAAQRAVEGVAKGRVYAAICDLSKPADVSKVFAASVKKLGAVDILINNQGGPAPGGLETISEEQFTSAVNTNVRSVFQLCRLAVPAMKRRGFGRVINILSITAKEPLPNMFLSNTFRPAILGLAKSIANEYAPFGITVNSLLPAAVMTGRLTALLKRQAAEQGVSFEQILKTAQKRNPMGRIAEPEEFARIAAFLSSPKASYITGTAIAVDGGASQAIF